MTGIEEGHWWNYKYLNIQGYCIGREKGKHIMRERKIYSIGFSFNRIGLEYLHH